MVPMSVAVTRSFHIHKATICVAISNIVINLYSASILKTFAMLIGTKKK